MRLLKAFSICVVATALHNAAWAEIYETTDAEGNPVFTDAPPGPNAEVIDLQKTNIIDAPPAEPQAVPAPQTVVEEQAPTQQDNPVIIHDDDNDQDDVYDEALRRERAFERMDPAAPDQVLDAEAPRQVGDTNAQMPHQVGDSNAQMPHQVGDTNAQMPHQVGDTNAQMPRQVGDSNSQMPREEGDFPAEDGAPYPR